MFTEDFRLEERNWRKKFSICESRCCLTAENEIKIFINHHVWSKKQDCQEMFIISCEIVFHEVC